MSPGQIPILLILILGLSSISAARIAAQGVLPEKTYYLEPELLAGKNIPVYAEFPDSEIRSTIMMSMGTLHREKDKSWVSYFNFPSTGISVLYSNLGNPEIYGQEVSILPYLVLHTSQNARRSWDFKTGLGASYFNNPYHAELNPDNLVIGSPYAWAFHLKVSRNLLVSPSVLFRLGLGYMHSSNAHTRLPNYGMNAAVLSLSAQFPTRAYDPDRHAMLEKDPADKEKHYFFHVRSGYGWHELGGTFQPIGGRTWPVYSQSFAVGIIFRQHIKVRMGITHRFYKSFHQDILKWGVRGFGENPVAEASNINVFVGSEFLLGHVGIDIEGGFNVHKPYYREFNHRFEFKEGFEYWRSHHISTRMGLKYYLITHEKMPRHNVSLGAHINANFGEADFMDISLGYTYLIK